MGFNMWSKWRKVERAAVPSDVKNCTRLLVRYSDGFECEVTSLKLWMTADYMWEQTGRQIDVVAYRVMK